MFGALLRQVSEPGTLNVVVIEDVHWADEATIDLLRFLGRRLRNAAVLLIVTYRDDGLAAGDPLRLALGDLARQRSTRRIGLAPLSADAVAGAGRRQRARGGRAVPADRREPVLRHRGRSGRDGRGPGRRRATRCWPGPRRLSGEARDVLDVAALIGTRVELRLLESVTACPPAAVDELLASGLLAGDGGWLRFRHEIARLAVEQAIAGAPRRRHPRPDPRGPAAQRV